MTDEGDPRGEHVFDQTNGLLGTDEAGEHRTRVTERDRRRQLSIAQGLGYISTGHN